MINHSFVLASRQRGAALMVSLVIMGLLLILSASAVKFATLDLRASINDELRSLAHQDAQSGIDGTLSLAGNTPVIGNADETNCLGIDGCTRETLTLPDELADKNLTVRVQRGTPAFVAPPRGSGDSLRAFTAAPFNVDVRYNQVDAGLGQAEVREGLIMLVPKF